MTTDIPLQNALVFDTNINRLQIEDFVPIKELECPTNNHLYGNRLDWFLLFLLLGKAKVAFLILYFVWSCSFRATAGYQADVSAQCVAS